MINDNFYNYYEDSKNPQIFFVGNTLSSTYTQDLINYIQKTNKDFSINVISKSGTTTEPAVAFRIFKELMEKKYGKEESKKKNLCYN